MPSTETHSGLDRMDQDECLGLLATENIGRLAIVQGNTPAIFPVTYTMDGNSIVFRTAPGTKLSHGPRATAAFEIDSFSREDRTGWSVVAVGPLEEVSELDPAELERLWQTDLKPWAGGVRDHWMRLVPGIITGRRVGPSSS